MGINMSQFGEALDKFKTMMKEYKRENRCWECGQIKSLEEVSELCLCKKCHLRYIRIYGLLMKKGERNGNKRHYQNYQKEEELGIK